MNKLWTFGDSFTHGDGTFSYDQYYKYKKDKKDENDLIWCELLSKKLNLELENKGRGGISNDMILDSIMENWEYIDENDYVIIGKTWAHRCDFPGWNNSPTLQTLCYNNFNTNMINFNKATIDKFDDDQIECIKLFNVVFADQQGYRNRQNFRFNFIKDILLNEKKVKKCVIWGLEDFDPKFSSTIETIAKETNDEILDYHWSYNGHRTFFNYINNFLI